MSEAERRAKLFRTGRSQAVRLPKEFRFKGTEVRIRRSGNSVVLEPIDDGWEWLWQMWADGATLDADVLAAVEEPILEQERPELDRLFPE